MTSVTLTPVSSHATSKCDERIQNSTFDMLDSAIRFKAAVKDITSKQDNNLRDYELSRDEWAMLEELRDALKVSRIFAQPQLLCWQLQ
jgi:hypothetical protein